ncbi:hypothetical protein [Altererythrobacter aquiaggeris]|uniref:hypothetical protein n=1 Tax=Aestuarierythrobacter aquiaggeris TaxID=1898396 RepID=UPI003018200B
MANAWPDYTPVNAENGAAGWGAPAVDAGVQDKPPSPKPVSKRMRLENGPQIRREIAKVYRGMKASEIPAAKGTKLIYALEVLSRHIEREKVDKLTDRLDALECR